MTGLEVFRGTPFEKTHKGKKFTPRNEIVGWTQGFHKPSGEWQESHGSSRPVTGLVVGREIRGATTNDEGELRINVQTYVKVTGNEFLLRLLKEASPHDGMTGYEFEITENLSPEYAFQLDYSQTEQAPLPEEAANLLIPLISTFLAFREDS